jgi:hypothetical protein
LKRTLTVAVILALSLLLLPQASIASDPVCAWVRVTVLGDPDTVPEDCGSVCSPGFGTLEPIQVGDDPAKFEIFACANP